MKDLALKINHSAQKFSMMIRDLSEFSELNSEVIFETVDLNKIVADVCTQLEQQLKVKNTVLKMNVLPSLVAIPLQMEQLFFHLISNAIRFSKTDTSLIIQINSLEPSEDQINHLLPKKQGQKFVEIRIQDNGIGIEKYQLEKIFDIFTWLPYDQIPDGGGIGLAYCRKIIRKHGGSITAQSEPGFGTTFCIILPVNQNTVHDYVFNESSF